VILGRVCGRVVTTIAHPSVARRKLLVVERLHPDGRPADGYVIALDTVGAGAGETVLVLDEGNGARQVLADPVAPVRAVVVGIVDAVVPGPDPR
jgi:microcompartment protein CcmK/EutM